MIWAFIALTAGMNLVASLFVYSACRINRRTMTAVVAWQAELVRRGQKERRDRPDLGDGVVEIIFGQERNPW